MDQGDWVVDMRENFCERYHEHTEMVRGVVATGQAFT